AVMQAWKRSMLGVLPSVGPETFGMVVLEAMQCGKPVIASQIGGLPDVVADGETGFLVPPGDPIALRQAMTRLLSDSKLRARMGKAARERAAAFYTSAIVPRIERAYRLLLEESKVAVSERMEGNRTPMPSVSDP